MYVYTINAGPALASQGTTGHLFGYKNALMLAQCMTLTLVQPCDVCTLTACLQRLQYSSLVHTS